VLGEVRKTTDGTTWSTTGSSADDDIYGLSISCPTTTTCFVANLVGSVRVTTDGASTWTTSLTSGAPDLYALACYDTTRCVAAGAGGATQYTTDGITWRQKDAGSSTLYGVSFPAQARAFAVGAGGSLVMLQVPGCGGGALSLNSFSSLSFPAVSLGGPLTSSATGTILVDDATGAGAGWSVSATSTLFTRAGGATLPAGATVVTAISSTPMSGNCALPSNTFAYPITLPAAPVAPAAVKIYGTPAATGLGPVQLDAGFQLEVPENAYAGSYTSTWTITIASGP
jgi:hypothetical protein